MGFFLLGKSLAGLLLCGLPATALAFKFVYKSPIIDIYVSAQTLTPDSNNSNPALNIDKETGQGNHTCMLKNGSPEKTFECKLFPVEIDSKNYVKKSDLVNQKVSENTTTITTNKIFELKVDSKDWKFDVDREKLIEVVNQSDLTKKYGILKVLFVMLNKQVINTTTKFFVGKADAIKGTVNSDETSIKCVFGDNPKVTDDSKECIVNAFSTTENNPSADSVYDNLTFTKTQPVTPPKPPVPAVSVATQHKHYLIEFTQEVHHSEIHSLLTYANADSPKENNVTFKNVVPAIYDGQSTLFIFDNKVENGIISQLWQQTGLGKSKK